MCVCMWVEGLDWLTNMMDMVFLCKWVTELISEQTQKFIFRNG